MDSKEAVALLEREMDPFRHESYAALVALIDREPVVRHGSGDSGVSYQIMIQFFWDSTRGGNVRVMGSVDDGGWRAFVPITRSFIKSPDGSIVGE